MSTPTHTPAPEKRSRRRPAVITVGALGTAALALSMSGTLSAFTASITNSENFGGVGSLVMQESQVDTNGAVMNGTDGNPLQCTTDATNTSRPSCSTINKYGGDLNMVPGGTKTTHITIANLGNTDAASFTLDAADCTLSNPATAPGDLCDVAIITVVQDGTTVFTGTPRQFADKGVINLSTAKSTSKATSAFDITFAIPADAPNTIQGESVSQPMTWTFNA